MKQNEMIDFEREIEVRLAQFQLLNGKGNVKDCNNTLYEIIRLMLGMIQNQQDVVESDIEEVVIINNRCNELEPDAPVAVEDTPAPVKAIHAPFGLTRFGNPKRDRSNHAKKPTITPSLAAADGH